MSTDADRIARLEYEVASLREEREAIEQVVHVANFYDGEAWGDKTLVEMVRELAVEAHLPIEEV